MSSDEVFVYYISKKEFSIQEIKQIYQDLPASIEVLFSPKDYSMSVINLHSNNHGKEYATHLFLHSCRQAKKRGISIITLDDCSDRYRKNGNIYTKLGMKYSDETGGPEMTGEVDYISKYETITDVPVIYYIQVLFS